MRAIDQLLELSDQYRIATGVEQSTVSWRVFGDTKKLRALDGGADIQVKRWEQAVRWFADNWPEGAIWPEGIPRPSATEPAEAP